VYLKTAYRALDSIVLLIIKNSVKVYQAHISPFLFSRCRFYPTCSEYALLSAEKHTSLKAVWYIIKRLSKCHPLHPGGVDPVQ